MTQIASKGTVLELDIATVFTEIAQVIGLDGPDPEVQVFDSTILNGAVGREKEVTGFVEGGTVSGSLFFDPVASTLQALTDLLLVPAVSNWKTIWSDTLPTEWPYAGILKKCKPAAGLDDGLKADLEIVLDGIVTYPS